MSYYKHGMSKSPEFHAWRAMRERCGNPNYPGYERYGGRGIRVCDAWKDSFEAFFAHVGNRPCGTSLDRIDNSKGYEPGNVRWANRKTQQQNTRRNRFIEYMRQLRQN